MKLEEELQKKEEEYEIMQLMYQRKSVDDTQKDNTMDEYDEIIKIMKLEFENELNRLNKYYQSKLEHHLEEKNLLDTQLDDKQNEINELMIKMKSLTNTMQVNDKIQAKSKTSSLQNTAVKTARFLNDNILSCSPAPTVFLDLTNFQSSKSQQILDESQYDNMLSYNSDKLEKKNNNMANINKMLQKIK